MNSYLITYDLDKPGKDYESLINRIKEYPAWAHICESSWCVRSSNSSKDIRDTLSPYLDDNDKLFVGKLTGEAAWQGLSKELTNWLHDNL